MSCHQTQIVARRHDTTQETRIEVHCSCGFVFQGASCLEHASAIADGHRTDPKAPVIEWNPSR